MYVWESGASRSWDVTIAGQRTNERTRKDRATQPINGPWKAEIFNRNHPRNPYALRIQNMFLYSHLRVAIATLLFVIFHFFLFCLESCLCYFVNFFSFLCSQPNSINSAIIASFTCERPGSGIPGPLQHVSSP